MRLRGCPRRRGATLVETAVVISCTMLLTLGIFEYCRFVFVLQVAEGAAREGARYAVAHTGDGTTLADVQNHVKNKMAGRDSDLVGYDAKVENVNPATGAIIPASAWNDAPFGGAIRVRITGSYRPMLPSLLSMSSSIPFSTTSMMTSEAN
jgi:Flp pilus assembly protein TadG